MAVPSTPASSPVAERVALRRVWWVGPLAIVAAAAVNAAALPVLSATGTFPADVRLPNGSSVSIQPVLMATVLGTLLGTLVFAGMGRFAARPIRTFRIVSAVALVLSAALPATLIQGAGPGFVAGLYTLHVLAAVVSVTILTTLARDKAG